MDEHLVVAIATIVIAGVGAQWLARALRIPSVLVLLPAGVLVGPVLGIVDPREVFGAALFPVVALAVGLILFEGGVGLRLAGAGELRRPVLGLVSIGALVTWLVTAWTSARLFDLPLPAGLLLGAILVVSGPTVVLPLLQTVRLREHVAGILRWECIVIDPIGAVLAVAVYEAILDAEAGFNPLPALLVSGVVGVAVGLGAGLALAALLRFHLVPDRLHNPVTLAMAVGCFVLANLLSVEAGLFATTTMGIVLANQRLTPVAHIAAFGEDVGVLVLGGLFVILGSSIDLGAMTEVLLPATALLVVVLAVRPVAVWMSTIGAGLRANERWYLSLIAPRGVVAASVATLFAVGLRERGIAGAAQLPPVTFCIVIGSVLVASAVARPAARRLHVAEAEPRGVVLAGEDPWVLDTAAALSDRGIPVLLVRPGDDGGEAAERGLLTFQGELDGEALAEAMAGVGVQVAVVATRDEAASSFLVERLSDVLGRRHVYRVTARAPASSDHTRAWGRTVFGPLADDPPSPADGWSIAAVPAAALADDPSRAVPLFALSVDGPPQVVVRPDRIPADATIVAAFRTPG